MIIISYPSFNEKSNMTFAHLIVTFLSSKLTLNLNFKIIHQNNLTLKGLGGN